MFLILTLVLSLPAAAFAQADPQEWLYAQPFMPPHARIGVGVQSMTPELREYFGVPGDLGVLVTHVEPGKPAAKAGLKAGDVIVEAGGRPVRSPSDLVMEVARAAPMQDLRLKLVRDEREQSMVVQPEGEAVPWVDPEYWRDWLKEGMREGSRELRQQLEDLQRRLEELERKFEEEKKERDREMHRT